MPDLFLLIQRRWKTIALITIAATVLAMVVSLLRPKEYLSTVTALPANSATTDKARLLNSNIEGLYPELGSADELDRIEGTVQLDTLYLSVTNDLGLVNHYESGNTADALHKAADRLRKQTQVRRSAYGELKINVWDKDAVMAAKIANSLLQKLNEMYSALVQANNEAVLLNLRKSLLDKQVELDSFEKQLLAVRSHDDTIPVADNHPQTNSLKGALIGISTFGYQIKALQESIAKHTMLIEEYSLALNLRPTLLLPVEAARPSLKPDRPKTLQTAAFTFGASLVFAVLLSLVLQSRKPAA